MSTAQHVAPKPQPQAAPSRMRLANIVEAFANDPFRITLYGPEGVGKTTFGAGAPKPILLGTEDGAKRIRGVKRFPTPETWPEVMDALRVLGTEKHEYESLVVDSLDWIEPLIWAYVCKRDDQANIEAYGYGKGYQVALDEWRRFLAGLERLKSMHIILLAHSWIKPFKNPAGEDFDRYEMKLHAKAAGLIKEWSEAVLFANWETFAKKDERTKRVRGVSSGARLIYTERKAAYDAKNRYSLPEELPLAWEDFAASIAAGGLPPAADILGEIQRKAAQLGGDLEKLINDTAAKASNDAEKLSQINNRVNAKLAERGL